MVTLVTSLQSTAPGQGPPTELALKIAFGVCVLALLASVITVARRLGERPEGKVNQTAHELPSLKIVRPALGIVFYLALFDWLLPGTRIEWASSDLSPVLRWSGVIVFAVAVLILYRSFSALGRNYRGGVGLWDDHELVLSGPYRAVRHPIYAAFVLMMLGIWATSASWLVGASGVLLTLSIPALRLKVEERELRERFGSAYTDYAESTPRFVPKIGTSREVNASRERGA